jgi:hypothetical protein
MADNDGTKEVQTITMDTAAAAEANSYTINGVVVSFTSTATTASNTVLLAAAVNASAALTNVVVATSSATAVTLTWLVDGDAAISTLSTTTLNADASLVETTPGTAGTNALNTLTGGDGIDSFVFGGSTGTGGSGAVASSTVFTTITDYITGVDTINFRTALTLVAEGTSSATQGVVSATGKVTFHADTADTLVAKLAATEAAMTAATTTAGEAALFTAASSNYLFVSDGVAGLGANDQLILLTGVTAVTGITLTNGNITAIV